MAGYYQGRSSVRAHPKYDDADTLSTQLRALIAAISTRRRAERV